MGVLSIRGILSILDAPEGCRAGIVTFVGFRYAAVFCAAFYSMANTSRTRFSTGAADKNTIPLSHTSKTLIFICAEIALHGWYVYGHEFL